MTDVQCSYDAEVDVLYISFGAPRPGIVTNDDDRFLVRCDPDTGEVVGLTIVGARQQQQDH